MQQISKEVTEYVLGRMSENTGVNGQLAELRRAHSHTPEDVRSFLGRNVPAELMERSNQALYPSVLVYCEKIHNALNEKFRNFAGTARVTVEIRNSHDRMESLDSSSLVYADAVCAVLTSMRGACTEHIFYNGEYEVAYSAARAGGKHFVQATKVQFEVDVSN